MKNQRPHILILLTAATAVAFPAAGEAKTKHHHSSSTHTTASSHKSSSDKSSEIAKTYKTKDLDKLLLAAQQKAADKNSLFNAGQAEYVSHKSLFDFGPKSSGIKYDKRMIEAAQIAAERARAHSHSLCWHAVKNALVDAKLVSSRPTTEYAKQAGDELQHKYGFTKLNIQDPYAAPIGSVLVYGGPGAGHVEFRTPAGFVSDFTNVHPSKRPLIGVYVKQS